MPMPRVDMTGKRVGRLTVLEPADVSRAGEQRWHCACDCGKRTIVRGGKLRRAETKSCGCLMLEHIRRNARRMATRHGMSSEPEYKCWEGIKQRCLNPRHPWYSEYGGRGITVHPEWAADFLAFFAYVGERPGFEYSLDRIDNNKGYVPGNVRWATYAEQAANRRAARRAEGVPRSADGKFAKRTP